MLKGKPSKVPGLMNAVPVWLLRFTPCRVSAAMARAAMDVGGAK